MKQNNQNLVRLGYVFATFIVSGMASFGVLRRTCHAQQSEVAKTSFGVSFDLESLSRAPNFSETEEAPAEGVKAIFFDGVPFKGQVTQVFAYYGLPSREVIAKYENQKAPAMVLIHGGGGTAFANWVKLWNERGYAAIAMDLCGCIPKGSYGAWQRHERGGPAGWDASFSQLDDPVSDQWTYHAVSAVALAHSLLRSLPEVDAERIGVTGISWGGYLTCIVAGVDNRFQFAAPVYGCGFLGDNSVWLPSFEKLGKDKSALWLKQWDPSSYLPAAKMPMLWVNGTNDFAYPMDSWQQSYRLPSAKRTLCLRIRMPHGHGAAGENPEEIHQFANALLRGGEPMPGIVEQGNSQEAAWANFQSAVPVESAELCFTKDSGKWQDRVWQSIPADIDLATKRVSATIPTDARVFYLNVFDARGCAVSTEHVARHLHR